MGNACIAYLELLSFKLTAPVSTMQITCNIVKLVLRNNSLTTLQGIENLKSLEGLDLSHNVISNFSELEILSALPSLRNLWLEGNPFCCAGWYRPQVFSYFRYPQKVSFAGIHLNLPYFMNSLPYWITRTFEARKDPMFLLLFLIYNFYMDV